MASVLFSTIGQALGGPLGGAVGAITGSGLDSALGSRRRSVAPEPGVPASSYAVPLPRLYGRTRTAGVLIWALAPVAGGGGKGGSGSRGGLVTSVAVALSARPIEGIGRVWADGREIRGRDGTFAIPVTMRVHDGIDESRPDPAIAAAEGMDMAPAFRNMAYVVLENLPLGGFGNRIPALSFEVIADPAEVRPETWLRDLGAVAGLDVAIGSVPGEAAGFSASGATWREDMADLAAVLGAEPGLVDGRLRAGEGGVVHQVPADDLVVVDDPQSASGFRLTSRLDERPASWTLSYLDPERDYQRGAQRAIAGEAGRQVSTGAAFTLEAASARSAAERLLRARRAAARRLDLTLSWKWAHVAPGDKLALSGVDGEWRVVERAFAGLFVTLECEATLPDVRFAPLADPGRALLAPVVPAGPSRIFWLEPPLSPRSGGGPELLVLATGGPNWRGAAVSVSDAEAGGRVAGGDVRTRTIHGTLNRALAAGPQTLWDEAGRLELLVDAAEDGLEGRTARSVLAGANLLLVGGELLQYREAEEIGAGLYRLSGLLRGRFFTAPVAHPAGARWAVVDDKALLALPIGADWIDRAVRIEAIGVGDPAGGTSEELLVRGGSVAPLAPCHVRAGRTPSGRFRISFVARERPWLDWSAATPSPDRLYRAHIRRTGTAGPVLSLPVQGTALETDESVVGDALGPDVSSLTVQVEAVGDGPADIRRTPDKIFTF
jgi:hypothetical protein